LDGRDEIKFIDGENGGNNIFVGGNGFDQKNINPGNDVIYLGDGYDNAYANDGSDVIYGEKGGGNFSLQSNESVIFGGDGVDYINHTQFSDNGLIFGGNGSDVFLFLSTDSSKRVYSWGGEGNDNFIQYGSTTNQSNNWIMDFNSRNSSDGGDTVNYFLRPSLSALVKHVWAPTKTQLVTHTADANHPFLSDGAKYYELQVQSSINSNDPNWYSLFNLVGTNGTDITVSGLFANGNLV